jgi:mRNA interferase RelE/StbE
MYRLFLTKEFDRGLERISSRDRVSIEKKIKEYMAPQLKNEPHYGTNIKKLKGYDPETWRYRIGYYRIFYIINEIEQDIQLISIEQRKDAY